MLTFEEVTACTLRREPPAIDKRGARNGTRGLVVWQVDLGAVIACDTKS